MFRKLHNGVGSTVYPNFKPLKVDDGFSVERYAFGVYRELHQALNGLVEESETLR